MFFRLVMSVGVIQGISPFQYSSILVAGVPPVTIEPKSSTLTISHSPLKPGNLFSPVSNCCMVPCLIFFFFSMIFSRDSIKSSMSESAVAIFCCSSFGGTSILTLDNTLPFVNALVVNVAFEIISSLTFFVEKQYFLYSSNNILLIGLALNIKPLKTPSDMSSSNTELKPIFYGVLDFIVKYTFTFLISYYFF